MTEGAQLWEAKRGVEREKGGASQANPHFLQRKTNGVQFVCSLCAFAVINFHLIRLGEGAIVHPN